MNTQTVENQIEFTRVNNDVNGNPRYVCHFLSLLNANERGYTYDGEDMDQSKPVLNLDISEKYALALKKARNLGGRKFHNKQYGGGIVFQSYNIRETANSINELINKAYQLRAEIISLYKKTLNPSSKWYVQDLAEFKAILSTKTDKEMSQQLANMRGIAGLDEGLNKVLEAEEKRMAKAGMYDLGKMKPENALD